MPAIPWAQQGCAASPIPAVRPCSSRAQAETSARGREQVERLLQREGKTAVNLEHLARVVMAIRRLQLAVRSTRKRLAEAMGGSEYLVASESVALEPLGFSMDDKQLKRAGLDYHEFAPVQRHANWEACQAALAGRRMFGVPALLAAAGGAVMLVGAAITSTQLPGFAPLLEELEVAGWSSHRRRLSGHRVHWRRRDPRRDDDRGEGAHP